MSNTNKIVKMVRETCKNTNLCFSSLICRTDLKDVDEKVIKTNICPGNHYKQQNLNFIDNSNIKKSDLNSRELHLHSVHSRLSGGERGVEPPTKFSKIGGGA